jgi:signal transduction histidine kinase
VETWIPLVAQLLWKLTVVLLVLTARLRHRLPPAEAGAVDDERRDAASEARGQTLFLTLLFPFVHFASYATGLLDLPSKPLREAMVAVWLVLIGAVAFLQYRILARTRRELREGNVSLSEELAWRRRAQEEKERLIAELEEKHAEMERFTYTVSHDLKSPLFTIQGFLGLLERDVEVGNREQMEEDMRRIRSAAGKMQQLLDELLELSRIGRIANEAEPTPLGELAEEAVELVAARIAERGVEVVVEPDLPTVVGDRRRLFEVFQNLIENAVKFMGDQRRPRIEIGTREEGGERVCYVRDNGRGIEPAYREKVFGLFERLEQGGEGTGIGLAIVKRVIELHGGRVWVESEGAGRGATFCFTLPEGETD